MTVWTDSHNNGTQDMMDGWVDGWMRGGWIEEINRWMDGPRYGWMDGWLDEEYKLKVVLVLLCEPLCLLWV